MATPTLIYCADGNKRLAEIAVNAGYEYGIQLPGKPHYPLYFADQDWKQPNREAYMKALEKHRPHMATVLDWEHDEQMPEVLSWAEEAAAIVEVVLIIPKVFGGVAKLPRTIGGVPIRLAYSVPTKYGGTQVPAWEFSGWPVHLLGGSPQKQMELSAYFDVRSIDGNMANKLATERCQFWVPGNAQQAKNRWWPTLKEAGIKVDGDAPYEAFQLSCENIMAAWSVGLN